jgi:hypothetical protein
VQLLWELRQALRRRKVYVPSSSSFQSRAKLLDSRGSTSGSARILVATSYVNRWFLLYGFGKNEQANIDDRELAALQKLAKALLSMTPAQFEHAVAERELVEITDEEKSNPH